MSQLCHLLIKVYIYILLSGDDIAVTCRDFSQSSKLHLPWLCSHKLLILPPCCSVYITGTHGGLNDFSVERNAVYFV